VAKGEGWSSQRFQRCLSSPKPPQNEWVLLLMLFAIKTLFLDKKLMKRRRRWYVLYAITRRDGIKLLIQILDSKPCTSASQVP